MSSASRVRKDSRGQSSADDSRRHSSRPSLGGGSRRDSPSLSLGGDLRRDSPKLSLGGGSSKRLHSRKAEGSSHCSSYKHRRHASPIPFDHEEEEAEDEFPLVCKPSRQGSKRGKYFCFMRLFFSC